MIVPVRMENLDAAAQVHSASWQASHRAFCTPEFVALHTPERQKNYLLQKMQAGSAVFLLLEDAPVGVVSVRGSLIEDLYVLPAYQNRGFGTRLLRFAMEQCQGNPTLWILENNEGAERLYLRMGFHRTGRRHQIANGLDEIELSLKPL